ncbi:TPA: DUF551 domain-containing protein [Escherichia coli]|nr:DUF551 domain-containing protein [Escherichia coli]HCD6089986.1 DUF551 domain-containing protein [Escherichia coli]
MTTITRERLLTIKQWRETYGPGSNVVLPAEEAEELARIALASLEAKPIGAFHIAEQQVDGTSDYIKDGEWPIDNGIIEVYAAPTAPVPLTEVQRAMLRDMDVEISAELEEEEEIYRDGIRKCIAALRYHHKRAETCSNGYTGSTLEEDTLKSINFLKRNNIAAMLQGAKPVSQTYNLPELIEGMEVSIDVSTCDADLGNRYFGTVTEALELDTAKNGYILLVQDAEPNFDINGNSPVTPGGWISCSDRMPEDTKMLLAFSQGEIVAAYWNWVVNPIDYKKYRAFTYLSGNILDDVTHWMPLPEPPL